MQWGNLFVKEQRENPIHQNSPKCKGGNLFVKEESGSPIIKIHESANGGPD